MALSDFLIPGSLVDLSFNISKRAREQRQKMNLESLAPFISRNIISQEQVPFMADTFSQGDPFREADLNQLREQGMGGLSSVQEVVRQQPGFFDEQQAQQLSSLFSGPQGPEQLTQLVASRMMPEEQKFTGPIQQYLEAKQLGLIPPEMDFAGFRKLGAQNQTINNVIGKPEEPVSPQDLLKMRLPDGTIPPYGSTPSEIRQAGGRVVEDITPEEAGKRQALSDAYRDVDTLRGFVFDDKGNVNRTNVLNMNVGTPFTKGRTMTSLLRGAVSAKVKAETGATANEEEIRDMMIRFDISPLDSDATILDKMDRLQDFMGQALSQTAPELYNKLINRSDNPPGVKTWKKDGYEYRQFPDGRTQRRKL